VPSVAGSHEHRQLPSASNFDKGALRGFARPNFSKKPAEAIIEEEEEEGFAEEEGPVPEHLRKMYRQMFGPMEYVEPRTPEEIALDRLKADRFARLRLLQTRKQKAKIQIRIRLKWNALNALPPAYRTAALKQSKKAFPPWLLRPVDQLPVEVKEEEKVDEAEVERQRLEAERQAMLQKEAHERALRAVKAEERRAQMLAERKAKAQAAQAAQAQPDETDKTA